MDTRENNLAWIIAGILLVLLIIVGYLWLSSRQDLPTVLENGRQDITALRAQIEKDCRGPEMDKDACNKDLSDLSSVLQEFSSDVNQATANGQTTP
jgi:hypothetical protein